MPGVRSRLAENDAVVEPAWAERVGLRRQGGGLTSFRMLDAIKYNTESCDGRESS